MERSFKQEVELLKLGAGETFRGEGILAVTKALLQSGVAYVGGYQGAPVSHMMDVLNDARDILDELGVHVETNASEAGAAGLLDPRPNLPKIVEMVEMGFQLSEASSTPVMLELRIRACHVHGSFVAKKNLSSKKSKNNPIP